MIPTTNGANRISEAHQLLTTHRHPSCLSENPTLEYAPSLVLSTLLTLFELRYQRVIPLASLWHDNSVNPTLAQQCRGVIGRVIESILRVQAEQEPEERRWKIQVVTEEYGRELRGVDAVEIVWEGFIEPVRAQMDEVLEEHLTDGVATSDSQVMDGVAEDCWMPPSDLGEDTW